MLPLGRWALLNSSTTVHEELPQLPIRQKGKFMKFTVGPFHTTSHTWPLPPLRYSSKVLWMESKIKWLAKNRRESFCRSNICFMATLSRKLKTYWYHFHERNRSELHSYTFFREMFCLPKLYKIVPIQESKKPFHISTTINNLGETPTGTRGSWFLLPTFISSKKNPQDDLYYSNL